MVASYVSPTQILSPLHAIPSCSHFCAQGASAVLCYGAIEAPLSQPRALVGGHFIAAVVGLCITKLFSLSPHFESIRWLAASLSTSVAIVAMQMTGTTHPPAGATALLPALDDDIWHLSWYYLPVVLLSSTLVLVSALIVNNVQRRYPMFWFTPAKPLTAIAKVSEDLGAPEVESDGASRNGSLSVSTSTTAPPFVQECGDKENTGVDIV